MDVKQVLTNISLYFISICVIVVFILIQIDENRNSKILSSKPTMSRGIIIDKYVKSDAMIGSHSKFIVTVKDTSSDNPIIVKVYEKIYAELAVSDTVHISKWYRENKLLKVEIAPLETDSNNSAKAESTRTN